MQRYLIGTGRGSERGGDERRREVCRSAHIAPCVITLVYVAISADAAASPGRDETGPAA
jgi:hypothetical protein